LQRENQVIFHQLSSFLHTTPPFSSHRLLTTSLLLGGEITFIQRLFGTLKEEKKKKYFFPALLSPSDGNTIRALLESLHKQFKEHANSSGTRLAPAKKGWGMARWCEWIREWEEKRGDGVRTSFLIAFDSISHFPPSLILDFFTLLAEYTHKISIVILLSLPSVDALERVSEGGRRLSSFLEINTFSLMPGERVLEEVVKRMFVMKKGRVNMHLGAYVLENILDSFYHVSCDLGRFKVLFV